MAKEIEAKFININLSEIITRLEGLGATKVFDERIFRRCVYNLPIAKDGAWARVRDEGDTITMTYKRVTESSLDGVEEVELIVDNFETAREFLTSVGLVEKAYQETKRMRYHIPAEQIEFDIDTWPGLAPLIEIEGASKEVVERYAHKLGFDWDEARFGGIGSVYTDAYQITCDWINNQCRYLAFDQLPVELQDENKRPIEG